jgi:uncharacterized protein DUF4331
MRKQVKRLIVAAAGAALLVAAPGAASSHREAPGITKTPKVDGTDFYMFNSYETGRAGYVTLIANYQPLQAPYGGPNFFAMDEDALYRIHIDNTGDGVEDITFQLKFDNTSQDIKLPVGNESVAIPLINAGPVSGGPGNRDATLNRLESYTVRVLRGRADHPSSVKFLNVAGTNSKRFGKPVDNIGGKSIADYESYSRQFITPFEMDGCSGEGRVFVGQRAEGFAVNLGEIFDLVNIANPLGPRDAEPNVLDDANVTEIAIEVPASCLTGESSVIGGWTTAMVGNRQVSRLGMPLVNEVVIGLKDKDKFNASSPKNDGQFATYVTNPTLPELLEILFGAAGVRAPDNFPRTDLVATFATGVQGLNFLSDGTIAEMSRLNTSIPAAAAASQNNLGVLGGDNAGFPNGRRPGDDVVDIELRAAMGVLCHAFPGVFCSPADAPSGALPFTDGTFQDASQFDAEFPYLKSPHSPSPN